MFAQSPRGVFPTFFFMHAISLCIDKYCKKQTRTHTYICRNADISTSIHIIEGSLEVKLPTIWTDEKQSREEAERRGRLEERRSEEKE